MMKYILVSTLISLNGGPTDQKMQTFDTKKDCEDVKRELIIKRSPGLSVKALNNNQFQLTTDKGDLIASQQIVCRPLNG